MLSAFKSEQEVKEPPQVKD